ncbi:MAG: helix-turn-helix transcriptional regulator [Treponema sp.]|jgi:AraC-like DNA-binding protein|nr:helix-turn-helix transcriptional regulator [Treponema sp.]
MEAILNLLDDVTKSYGVHMARYGEDFLNLENYDGGLRSQLFSNFKAEYLIKSLKAIMPRSVHITRDAYGCYYCFFRIPGDSPLAGYCIIGPWLEEYPDDATVDRLIKQRGIPSHLKPELTQYLAWVTLVTSPHSWRNALFAFATSLYGSPPVGYVSYIELDVNNQAGEYRSEQESVLSIKEIEERYNIENMMVNAVSKGDGKEAFQYFAKHRSYREKYWAKDELKYRRAYAITLNTLSRKAAEQGYVHPLHIDAISADFIHRIEVAVSAAELHNLCENILHHYCRLVREFSFRGCSPVVRDIINFVNFNLKEPLSLKTLATRFNINASYLSALFKKEKGITLTDYINSKRIDHAASLLRDSGLYIQDIAEQCGFLDFSYFTRLFKRYYGQSPRKFRVHFTG